MRQKPTTNARSASALPAMPESEPGVPPPENKKFYPALDGLRAVAVLMVFSAHYMGPHHPWMAWGWAGVDVFFVLSGFLITGVLFDTQDRTGRFRIFYIRRALRIFPLYYGVLFLALLTTPIFHWFWNRASLLWFVYLGNFSRFFFAHSNLIQPGGGTQYLDHLVGQPFTAHSPMLLLGHFWSLCVEEQFYLVWPLVVFSIGRRTTLRNLCLLSVPVLLAARVLCLLFAPKIALQYELLYRATPLRVDALLIGGALALMLRGPEAERVRRSAMPLLGIAAAGFLLWEGIFRYYTGSVYHPYAGAPVLTTVGYTLIDLVSGLLILALLRLDNPLAHALNHPALRGLGRISYGFYVFHDLFHIFIVRGFQRLFHREDFPHDHLLVAAVGFVLTLVLATLSYHFFEVPFLRLKDRFTIEGAGAPTAADVA